MTTEQKLALLEKENRQLKSELQKLRNEKSQEINLRQDNLLEQILNEIPVGIALHEGPEFITTVINESYYTFAFGKGDIVGRKVADVWPEVADQIIPLLTRVYETGEPYHAEDAEFSVDRGKGLEKAYFSFSYFPFKGEKDKVKGVLVWAFETTSYVNDRQRAENVSEELQENKAHLEATIDSLPDGYIIYDNEGKVIRMNRVAEKILGFSEGDKNLSYMERIALLKVLTPDGNPFPLEQIPSNRAQRGEKVRGAVMKINRKDHQHWLSVSASPVLLSDGKKIGVVMEFSDITDLKNTEIALRESKTTLDVIIDTMPAGVLIANDKGKIIRHNKAAVELWGLPPETNSWEDYREWIGWWPKSGKRIKAGEWGMSRALLKGEEVVNELIRNQKFNSEEKRYFLNNAVPLKNDRGEITGGVVAMLDVTESIAAEEALRESEEKFRAVFEQAAVGIGRVGFQDATWIDVNAAFCNMLGYSVEEFKRTPWPDITHPDDVDLDLIPFRKMAAGELDNYSVEKRFIHKKGHFVWARLTLSLVRDRKGHPDYEIAIIENITQRKQAEEAFHKSEYRFRKAFQISTVGILFFDVDGNFLNANDAFLQMIGYDRETLEKGKLNSELVTLPEWMPRTRKAFTELKENGLLSPYEKQLVRPDGSRWWGLFAGTLLSENEAVEFVIDVTGRKQAEQSLREREELFRTMADNISQLAWMADEKGSVFWFNQRWYNYTGTSPDGMKDRGWEKVHHPDHVDRVMNKLQHSWDTGERWEDIFPLRGENDRYRWFLSRAVPIRDNNENIIRWFGTYTDVTDQRKSEQLLKKQARMLDQVQDAIIGIDNNSTITYMNEAAYQMYEIKKRSEVLGSKLGEFYTVQWDHIDSEREMYNKLDKEGTWTGENIHVTSNGKKLWVDSVVSALKDEKGKITGIISAMRDISHRKEMEEVLNKQLNDLQKDNDLFENILYIIAHDLKGPIANMYMALNLINSVNETGEKIKMLNMFRPLVERVENTIRGVTGILQVQKTDESAAAKVYFESILNDILLELKENLKPGALESDFNRKSIRYIEPFLTSIMKNLINNAIKYSRENTALHIQIATENINGFILLMVKDNGIGIDLEKHGKQLFSPFKRFSPQKAEGTGVGLYIIKNIVEKNGGYVEVTSTPGKGTAFYCYLREY